MSETVSAFFYGTLLHPSILRRVIGHDGAQLEICPALLLEHTRHKIKYADYPGVIPYTKSRALFSRELTPEERTVRGTVVTGLNLHDIDLLDIFEGREYTRQSISVHPLGSFTSLESAAASSTVPMTSPLLPPLHALPGPLSAQTYIWARPLTELTPELWEYADFVRDNAWKWVGDGSRNNADYAEVDRRRAMNGNIVSTETVSTDSEDHRKTVMETFDEGTVRA
ncbi:hypothetical protein BKA93DRAFT_796907 [Sparassis latifolia]